MSKSLPITAVYVHIPFCQRKCLYCDFASFAGKESLFQDYVESLLLEIRSQAVRFLSERISTIYFGGGTPNLLSPSQLESILATIRSVFKVDKDAEISTEVNPGIGIRESATRIRDLRGIGFNRLSLGVQSFRDEELVQLGRIHTAQGAVEAFQEAREAGFENISIDLMYGIPAQTFDSWRTTLGKATDLGSEHISLYSLTVEAGTPFYNMQSEGKLTLPESDVEADMYEEAIRSLTTAGFLHYEISNFAKPGRECRHNITYWRNEPYFGFGAGAASYLNGVRAINTSDVEDYVRLIRDGNSPVKTSESLPERESMGETMFLGLRMLRGVDISSFTARYGVNPMDVFHEEIQQLTGRGLLENTSGFIRLTKRGLLLANEVFAAFV